MLLSILLLVCGDNFSSLTVLSSADFFLKIIVFQIIFRNTIRLLSGLDSDQDRPSVGSDLGSNSLQMSSANDKVAAKI